MIENYFKNNYIFKDGVHIVDAEDSYTENFGKQWKKYNFVQIDSKNNFNISENFLNKLLFNKPEILKDKTVLEIGCGAGRFTEHILKLKFPYSIMMILTLIIRNIKILRVI